MKDDLPYWENAYREVLLQEATITEEEAKVIEANDKRFINTFNLMTNVLGARHRGWKDGKDER